MKKVYILELLFVLVINYLFGEQVKFLSEKGGRDYIAMRIVKKHSPMIVPHIVYLIYLIIHAQI